MNSPSASPVTVARIIRLHMRVPRIAAATIQGRDHYRVCKTFVVAPAAAIYLPRTLLLEN